MTSVADIQTLVGAIDTNLPNLPPISAADQTTAVQTVTDGAYERVAIADNAGDIATLNGDDTVAGSVDSKVAANSTADQDYADAQDALNSTADQDYADAQDALNSTADQDYADAQDALNSTADQDYTDQEVTALENGAVATNTGNITNETETRSGLIRREADGIHIGTNSFILDDTLGNHVLTTDDGSFTLGGGAVTEVDVDADLDVDGDIFASGDIFINGNAGVQAQLDTNAASIANNAAAITSNTNSIAKNREDIDANTRGIAMVAALQHTTVLPGMTHALDISGAHFEGETGMALNYARRINENVQINFGAASTTDFDESVIKAGVGIQW